MTVPRIHPAPLRVGGHDQHAHVAAGPAGHGRRGRYERHIAHTARRLAEGGAAVDVFTRATSSRQPEVVEMADGVLVHSTGRSLRRTAGKGGPAQSGLSFTAELLRVCAQRPENFYDVVHSHYWLSGQAGWLAAQRWSVPLVHSDAHHGQGEERPPGVLGQPRAAAASGR